MAVGGEKPVSSLTDGGSPAMSINKHVTVISLQGIQEGEQSPHWPRIAMEAHERNDFRELSLSPFPYTDKP